MICCLSCGCSCEQLVQSHERFFGHRVARNDVLPGRRPDHVAHVVRHPDRGVEQRRFARGAIVVHGGLDQAAGVVDVVLPVVVAAVESPSMCRLFQLRVRVQISVGIFRRRRGNALECSRRAATRGPGRAERPGSRRTRGSSRTSSRRTTAARRARRPHRPGSCRSWPARHPSRTWQSSRESSPLATP